MGGRRKRHHTFFFQINLQVNSASGFGRFVEARAVSAICVVSGTAEQLQIFLPKEVWCLFLLVDNPAVLDLCLAAQILTGHDSPDYYMQACVDDTLWPLVSSYDINDYPFFSTNMSKKLIKSSPLDTQMMWNPYRMERVPPIPAPSPKNKIIPK